MGENSIKETTNAVSRNKYIHLPIVNINNKKYAKCYDGAYYISLEKEDEIYIDDFGNSVKENSTNHTHTIHSIYGKNPRTGIWEQGGYVEYVENLDMSRPEYTCWIGGKAIVFGNACVSGNAQVFGNACVSGESKIYDNTQVFGYAWICGTATVCGNIEISDNIVINDKVIKTRAELSSYLKPREQKFEQEQKEKEQRSKQEEKIIQQRTQISQQRYQQSQQRTRMSQQREEQSQQREEQLQQENKRLKCECYKIKRAGEELKFNTNMFYIENGGC